MVNNTNKKADTFIVVGQTQPMPAGLFKLLILTQCLISEPNIRVFVFFIQKFFDNFFKAPFCQFLC